METSLFLQTYSPSQQCKTSTASNSKTSRKHRGLTSRKVRNMRGGRADFASSHATALDFLSIPCPCIALVGDHLTAHWFRLENSSLLYLFTVSANPVHYLKVTVSSHICKFKDTFFLIFFFLPLGTLKQVRLEH